MRAVCIRVATIVIATRVAELEEELAAARERIAELEALSD
jgi:hypothetical protein